MKLRSSELSAHFHTIFSLSINEKLLTNQQHLIYSFICSRFINECNMLLYCWLYSFRSFFMIWDLFLKIFRKIQEFSCWSMSSFSYFFFIVFFSSCQLKSIYSIIILMLSSIILSQYVTSVPRLYKAEALINSQWTLASSLRND